MSHALTTGFDRRRALMIGCLALGALDLAFIDGVALPRAIGSRAGRSPLEGHPPPTPPAAAGERPPTPTIIPTPSPALALTIHFKPAEAGLTAPARAAVDALAATAAAHPGWTFAVNGHADARGEADFNERLSELRAATVAARLESAGVAGSRLATTAFGSSRPLAAGGDPRSLRRNRRVEIFIVRGGP